MVIVADFNRITGKIKPMHGVGQPPAYNENMELLSYLKEAGIPYSRLHDVGGWYGNGIYVDIPNLFRNFNADENSPDSYDFVFTYMLIAELVKNGVEPYFRLGVTIENASSVKAYRIYPPEDFEKWARICEHVVRHYNEGWANGFYYGIKYWEIWNEPDDCLTVRFMWLGTPQDYFRLYEVTAKHLKNCFGDSIKVGGYGSIGFRAINQFVADERDFGFISFFKDFLSYIGSEEHRSPIDFFSWHCYNGVKDAVRHAEYCRKTLNEFGFSNIEDHLNEWNICHTVETRGTVSAAANTIAMMLAMQKQSTSVLCYYDARIGASVYSGIFNPDSWKPYPNYFAFKSFNSLYKLENEVFTSSDNDEIYVGGVAANGKKVLIISNIGTEDAKIRLDVAGAELTGADAIVTEEGKIYQSVSPDIRDGILSMKAGSFIELNFR